METSVTKFNVHFTRAPVMGKGAVHLQDRGLILEGEKRQSPLVDFLDRLLQGAHTTRTIPYSVIREYKKPHFLTGRLHSLKYLLPNGKQQIVQFQLTSRDKRVSDEFTRRLEENRTAVEMFTGG